MAAIAQRMAAFNMPGGGSSSQLLGRPGARAVRGPLSRPTELTPSGRDYATSVQHDPVGGASSQASGSVSAA